MEKQYLEAGEIVNTHGVKGEMKLNPWCDAAAFLLPVKRFYIDGEARTVLSSRVHKGALLFALSGVDSVEKAMALRGKVVSIDRSDVRLDEGAHFVRDLIGLAVYDRREGRPIGRLADVLSLPASDVYVIAREGKKDAMIPAVGAFVKEISLEKGVVEVETIEGMLDED